jgi:predicted transcriptional regulator
MRNHQERNRIKPKSKTTKQNSNNDPLFAETKRTTFEIYAKMLQICQKPQNKTRIMYKTNTSYTSFKKYLNQLQQKNLLQKETENKNTYKTTQRGKTFLEKYNELQQFLNDNDQQKSPPMSS